MGDYFSCQATSDRTLALKYPANRPDLFMHPSSKIRINSCVNYICARILATGYGLRREEVALCKPIEAVSAKRVKQNPICEVGRHVLMRLRGVPDFVIRKRRMFQEIVLDAPFHKYFGAKRVVMESGLGFAVFGARHKVAVQVSFSEFVERN